MEYKKDIQKNPPQTDTVTHKGQDYIKENKDENSVLVRYDHLEQTIGARIEKLITALYMVTDYIDDSDPLRKKMRSLGVSSVSLIAGLIPAAPGRKHALISELEQTIAEIVSYLSIAVSTGLISPMNYSILKKEFAGLKENCSSAKGGVYALKKDIAETSSLGTIAELFLSDMPAVADTRENKDVIKDNISLKDTQKFSVNNVLYNPQYPVAKTAAVHNPIWSKKTLNPSPAAQKNLSRALDVGLKIERKNKILKLIREKKEVMIKDISAIISDCSEKTIQRELSALVSQGVLNKIGEKRWSRYSLAGL